MTDTLSPLSRSALMARIGPRNTRPEMIVRRLLHARGWRYRLHIKKLPGTPDIVLAKHRAVIFVNGCFWHGHACRKGRLPTTRVEFWTRKINANRLRDQTKIDRLLELGWRVMTVWQCCLSKPAKAIEQIETFLRSGEKVGNTVCYAI